MKSEEMLAHLREKPVALSIRAPWTHYVFHNGKGVENRLWGTKWRGPVLIHQSLSMPRTEFVEACCWADAKGLCDENSYELFQECRRLRGHIIGVVEVVDCVTESDSPWFVGPFGFVLANPVAFARTVPCKGRLGFFRPDCDLSAVRLPEAPR